jgi:hypothetical protein
MNNIKWTARETKRGPLKKVVKEFAVERKRRLSTPAHDMYEELECGHVIRKPKDLYGEYHASRRRCVQCAAQQTLAPDAVPASDTAQ